MLEEIAKNQMQIISDGDNVFSIGEVISVNNNLVEVTGLNDIFFFEAVSILNKARGYIYKINESSATIAIVEQKDPIKVGDKVYCLNKPFTAAFSMDSLGKVVDIFGNDLMANKKFASTVEFEIETKPIPIIDRKPVKDELLTGITGVDMFYPIGKGQRQLIIGDKKTGKTQLVLDTITNQKNKNVLCIYVAIGKTKKEVKELYYDLIKQGASSYTIIIASFEDDLAAKSYLTPYAATSLARFFMMLGVDVLLSFDDLKHHADIYRHMSLFSGKTPGRDAYPSDIFYAHAKLLENGCNHEGGGSITILPICETKNGDITDYISTNIISICDGQIVLSLKKFNKGQLPAIEYGLSVSRLGGNVQSPDMKRIGAKTRQELLSYLEIKDVYELVNLDDLGETMKKRMIDGSSILSKLNQYKFSPLTKEEMVNLFENKTEVK